jgi:signal peptide peptidase SppA
MSFKTISAIIRGQWAINPTYAQQMMPMVVRLLAGDAVQFGFEKPTFKEATLLFHAGASGVFSVSPGETGKGLPNGSVAVVDIVGPVMKYGDACSYGSVDHAATITNLANAGNISAIILNIDSPGGQVDGTALLADAVKAATAKKPVIAMINDGMAASAAMWIASAANEIYTTKKSDTVGSIGVYMTLADMSGFYEQKGIQVRDIYADQSTDKNGAYREALKGNDAQIKEELNATAEDFINTIKANRGDKLKGDGWATGKMFRAGDATKMGLIDGVKSFDQIIKRAQKLQSNFSNMSATNNTGEPVATENAPVVEMPVAFQNIMQVANITEINISDDGFVLDENALNAVENHLSAQNTYVQTLVDAALQNNERIAALEASAATTGDQAATIAQLEATIQERDATIAQLEAAPDGTFSNTTKPVDNLGASGKGKYWTSFDDEKAKLNAMKNGNK